MSGWRQVTLAAAAAVILASQVAVPDAAGAGRRPGRWIASWASGAIAPSPGWSDWGYLTEGFDDQTLRQVVHTSIGGSAARITLNNVFGTAPLRIGAASVAVSVVASGSTAEIIPDTATPVTFGGSASVTVAPGAIRISDPVALRIPRGHDLAVDLFLAEPSGPPNGHVWAAETSYAGAGDLVGSAGGAGFTAETTSSYFVTAVDVWSPGDSGAVVVLGDSLSDGILAIAPDTGQRWSDRVFQRLADPRLAVVNVAIAGNALHPVADPASALARLDRDVLSRAGVATIVMLLGTNDILVGRTDQEIVQGMREVSRRAHAVGVRVVGATIPPLGGAIDGTCAASAPVDPGQEQVRQVVNAWIRSSGRFDAITDVDAVLRNPAAPDRIRCALSFVGNFHPGAAGHLAIGNAIDLCTLSGRASIPG